MSTDRPTNSVSDEPSHTCLSDQDAAMDPTVRSTSQHDGVESSCSSSSHIESHPVTRRVIDLRNVDVDAIWQEERLSGVLALYWDGVSKAYLKLQVPINITANPSLPKKMNLYLLISPERIKRVSLGPSNDLFGPDTQTLDFVLSRSPFLVVPSLPWEPRDEVSKKTRDLLCSLAAQTHFTLCAKFVSSDDVRGFCAAASGGSMSVSSERADAVRFYRGHGRIVEGDSIFPEAPAPAYDESPATLDNKKRRRRDSIESVDVPGTQDNGKKRRCRSNIESAQLLGSKSAQPPWGAFQQYLDACRTAAQERNAVGAVGMTVPRIFEKLEQLSGMDTCMSTKLEQLSGMDDRVSAKLEQLSGLEGRISAKLEQLSGADSRVSAKLEQLSGADGRVSAKLEQLSGVEGRVSVTLEKLLGVEGRLSVTLEQLSGVDGRVSATLEKLSGMEAYVYEELNRMRGELDNRQELLQGAWEETSRAMDATEAKVDELRQGVRHEVTGISNALDSMHQELAVVVGREVKQVAREIVRAALSQLSL